MTKWLASVQSLAEAEKLSPILPDILDMKNPAQGALGALDVAVVSQIVQFIAGHCQTSATIGDLPMNPLAIGSAIIEMAESGVDYIKIALFPDPNLANCIIDLVATIKTINTPIIGVLFADKLPEHYDLPLLHRCGFAGVMIDTAIKDGQSLLAHWDQLTLANFVALAHQHNMICGLAGALRQQDIKLLQVLGADYLGFRSALCKQQNRCSALDLNLARTIQNTIINYDKVNDNK